MTTTISDERARGYAESLYEARRTGVPIAALTDDQPDLGMLDGYAVQEHLVRMLLADGESIAGYKLGGEQLFFPNANP